MRTRIGSPARGPSVGVWRTSSRNPGNRSSVKRSRIAAAMMPISSWPKRIPRQIRERFTLERLPGHALEIRQTPTLGPRGGLPMRVRTRRQ